MLTPSQGALTDEQRAQLHDALAPSRARPLGTLSPGGYTDAEWDAIHIGHITRLLNEGNYGGARLQAGALRDPRQRRAWIAYVDACRNAAITRVYGEADELRAAA